MSAVKLVPAQLRARARDIPWATPREFTTNNWADGGDTWVTEITLGGLEQNRTGNASYTGLKDAHPCLLDVFLWQDSATAASQLIMRVRAGVLAPIRPLISVNVNGPGLWVKTYRVQARNLELSWASSDFNTGNAEGGAFFRSQ